MDKNTDSYRQIFKATSIFGGVQVWSIFISIVRSKFIAELLGPLGMGITGLFTSALTVMTSLSNLGLETSAVKDVAVAGSTHDDSKIALTVAVMRRWVWITGFIGMFLTIIFSPLLSRYTFESDDYTFSFIWLSLSILFNQLTSGQNILLQGLRKLNYLAKANLIGSSLGLICIIPLYYYLGIKGIVPAILLSSVITLVSAWSFAQKVKLPKVNISAKTTWHEGKTMIMMGLMISLSGLLTNASSYILRAFISLYGDISQVGLYSAGFTIIGSYVGLIFSAMAVDYYPRLSEVAYDNTLSRNTINKQAELALLILGPMIMIFLVFVNVLLLIMYSEKFIQVNTMILWASIGMFFKATSWAVAFLFLAKSASKLFFINELVANIYILAFNMVGYYVAGLTGLGISFLIGYLCYMIQVFIICRIKYEFYFHASFIKVFIIQFGMAFLCLLSTYHPSDLKGYLIGVAFILVSGFYSYRELNKRLDFNTIKKYLRKDKTNDPDD